MMLRTFKVKLLVSSVPSTPIDPEKKLKSEKLMDDNNDRCKVMSIYNYGPLCRETSRFVNLREKQPPEG